MTSVVLDMKSLIDSIAGLSATLLLPVFLFIYGLMLGQKLRKALLSALTFAAAFIGLRLVLGLLIVTLSPAMNDAAAAIGIKRDILDAGWGIASAVSFGTAAGALMIPVSLGVNYAMLALRATKTLNADVWNLWHFAFTSSVVQISSGSLLCGVLAGAIHAALCLILADLGAKRAQSFYNVPGISIPHAWAISSVPIIIAVNRLLDLIPFIRSIEMKEESFRKKWSIFGNPLILGSCLGLAIGVLAGYWREPDKWLTLGITVAAIMVLIPKINGMFMEAFSSISDSTKQFMTKRFQGRELHIGVDSSILIGHPSTVASAIALIPIVIALSFLLPGNRVLAMVDLGALVYFVNMVPLHSNGSLFRSVISGTVLLSIALWICTAFGNALTTMAASVGYEPPAGSAQIAALSTGNWMTWVLFEIGGLLRTLFS